MEQDTKKILGALAVMIVIAGLAYFFIFKSDEEPAPMNETGLVGLDEIATAESLATRLAAQYQPQRDSYGVGAYQGKQYSIKEIFNKLPPVPDDFWKHKYLVATGQITPGALCDLPTEVYEQPEFIKDNFVNIGLKKYREPDPLHWTPEGYGTYPHQMESLANPGAVINVCTFFHSSWAVETYQGFSLQPAYPGTVEYGGEKVTIDTEASKKYLRIAIEPAEIVISPSYMYFMPGWSKKVNMTVTVSPDAPPGLYAIGFDVGRASLESTEAWHQQYGEQYQSKSMIQISEPQFIKVVKVRGST